MCFRLSDRNILIKREHDKYSQEAENYLHSPQKTEGLISKAIKKANRKKGSLSAIWEKLQLLIELIKAYSTGEYREISAGSILTVIGAILYFVSPMDLIPDFLAGLGFFDDAAVLGYTVKKINRELEQFSHWKQSQERSN